MRVYVDMTWRVPVDVDPADYDADTVEELLDALNGNPDAHEHFPDPLLAVEYIGHDFVDGLFQDHDEAPQWKITIEPVR